MAIKKLREPTLNVTHFFDEFEKDEIKKRTDIVKLFHSFGVKLTKSGKNYKGLCPWHNDKEPSLSVDPVKKEYHCFGGGCGESGDVVRLVEKMKGYSFREAMQYLKDNLPAFSVGNPNSVEIQNNPSASLGNRDVAEGVPLHSVNRKQGPGEEKEAIQQDAGPIKQEREAERITALTDVVNWYAKKLHESKEAREYLAKRGLDDPELINRFKLGFADGSLLTVIGETQKKDLIESGILNEKDNRVWEHFNNCITFPILDEQGQAVGIYGRQIETLPSIQTSLHSVHSGSGQGFKHRYLKGGHKGVFNRKASIVYKEILLTECIIDALSLVKLGIENVQSLYGTNGFTDEHLQILKDDRVKTVVLALDNDEPGQKASEKLKAKLLEEGFGVKVIEPLLILPLGSKGEMSGGQRGFKDWNEYLCSSTDLNESARALKEQIGSAELFFQSPKKAFAVTRESGNYLFEIESLNYRVSGVKDFFAVNLKVNIKVTMSETPSGGAQSAGAEAKHFDSIDLYSARSRASFAATLSKKMDVEQARPEQARPESVKVEKDLIVILEYLEAERDRNLFSAKSETIELTEEEKQLGLTLLQSPTIFDDIVNDMETLGYVGEDLNKLLLYIAASSRKLDDPISVLILSESASGKSMLMETVAKLMPEEDVVSATSLSDQALNYLEDLMHKFVTLGEIVHSEAVDHQIREMLSGKELSRLVTVKDEKTGKMSAKLVKTPAVVSLVMSGTSYDINPENASRCFLINTDESREQTRRIHEKQREKYTLESYKTRKDAVPQIIQKHQCAQRMLRKIAVMNPLTKRLNFPDTLMRARRDHPRFIDLIVCCAHLRQFQKEVKFGDGVEYIECDFLDYEIAHRIMVNGVLSSTMRELPKSVIEFYEMLREMVREMAKKKDLAVYEVSFTQREIREYSGYGNTWVKKNMRTLVDYEYVVNEKGGRERSKGLYRLKADEPISALDLSMIPTPEEMKELLKQAPSENEK